MKLLSLTIPLLLALTVTCQSFYPSYQFPFPPFSPSYRLWPNPFIATSPTPSVFFWSTSAPIMVDPSKMTKEQDSKYTMGNGFNQIFSVSPSPVLGTINKDITVIPLTTPKPGTSLNGALFTGGNYLWDGAMNLAWNELLDSYNNGNPLDIVANNKVGSIEITNFNKRPFTVADLSP